MLVVEKNRFWYNNMHTKKRILIVVEKKSV